MGVRWMTPERFALKTKRFGSCLIWQGRGRIGPYGVAGFGGEGWLAHRLAFYFHNGFTPPVVRHRCDTPLCVEPAHLLPGDHADNARDKVERNRQQRGESHPAAVLTLDQVREVRSLVKVGVMQKDLAERYGVSKQQVSKIVHGQRWAEK